MYSSFVFLAALTDDFSGVYAYGFERPSAIQQRAIMPIIKGQLTDGNMMQ